MAQRRMFAKTIIDSDAFLDMPQSSQLLYFHLSMRADDEGFINNPKAIMRNIGCKEDDAKLLIAKKFIIPFESGVVVIKHWKIHNYIAKDRFTPTKYQEERATLELDDNNSYTTCIQPVYEVETQVRLGKVSIGKDSIGEDKKETFVSVIASYTTDPSLSSSLKDYVEMRKKMKGFTIRALKLNLNELDKLATTNEHKVAIVDQTIANSWKGFFPVKHQQTIVQTWEQPKEEEMSEAERRKLLEEMEKWVEEPSKEEHIEKVREEYYTLLEMQQYGCDVEERIKNAKMMYKDLTGKELP